MYLQQVSGTPKYGQLRALLENLALCRLRIAKVHHLVHKFVDEDKVVADRFLLQLFKVFDEDGNEAVKEEDDLGGIGVPF